MRKVLSFCFFFIFAVLFLRAQEKPDMTFPKTRIGWTPSALANAHPGFQLSFDQRLSELVNFSLESGYLFTSFEGGQGYRFRTGVETFLTRSRTAAIISGLHFTHRNVIGYNNIERNATNGEFIFIDYNQKSVNTLTGINIENDFLIKLSPRTFLEIGGGLGLGINKRIRGTTTFIIDGVTTETRPSVNFFPQFIFYTHLNISYVIRQ